MQTHTVYHRGINTCSLKPVVAQNDELMTEADWENSDIVLTGIVRRRLNNSATDKLGGCGPAGQEDNDKQRKQRVKHCMIAFQNLETQFFEAAGDVKTTADRYDKYLIYSVNS